MHYAIFDSPFRGTLPLMTLVNTNNVPTRKVNIKRGRKMMSKFTLWQLQPQTKHRGKEAEMKSVRTFVTKLNWSQK